MMKVIPKAWSYAFSVMDGTESVAQAVDLSWWRVLNGRRGGFASSSSSTRVTVELPKTNSAAGAGRRLL